MENREIDTSLLPDGSRAFYFGSGLGKRRPRDLDVLIVYDSAKCQPRDAYREHLRFIESLEARLSIPVDATLLTAEEERNCSFIR